MTDKFCINCKYSQKTDDPDIYVCLVFPKTNPDPVTGKVKYSYCSVLRMPNGACGIEGQLFERQTLPNINDFFPN